MGFCHPRKKEERKKKERRMKREGQIKYDHFPPPMRSPNPKRTPINNTDTTHKHTHIHIYSIPQPHTNTYMHRFENFRSRIYMLKSAAIRAVASGLLHNFVWVSWFSFWRVCIVLLPPIERVAFVPAARVVCLYFASFQLSPSGQVERPSQQLRICICACTVSTECTLHGSLQRDNVVYL